MSAILLVPAFTATQPKVVAVFADPAANREGIMAERIKRPAAFKPEAFADELVKAEGLTSWNPQDPTSSGPGGRLHWRARHAADGREVVIYFAPASDAVCRIRRPRAGLSSVHYQAVRWCAASFGITLPKEAPAPVVRAAMARGSDATAFGALTPPGVAAFVRDRRLTRYSIALSDLNGDDRSEALIYAMATEDGKGQADLCGSGGCVLYVLSLTSTGYRQVTRISIARPPIHILPTRTRGWHDLAVLVAGGGVVPGYQARLQFNGRSYPSNPTVPPATPLKGDAGKQVIRDKSPMLEGR